jgi:hypothetical protein
MYYNQFPYMGRIPLLDIIGSIDNIGPFVINMGRNWSPQRNLRCS